MNRRRRIILAALAGVVGLGTTAAACSGSSGSSQQAAGNAVSSTEYAEFNAAVPYPFAHQAPSDPLERKNLARRLEQYNAAGDTNYLYIFTYSGQVLGYYVIAGKVSSTGSQMTPTQVVGNCSDNCTGAVTDAIGDDGSYGPEEGGSSGVFAFTSTGTLIETDQPFLVPSTPIAIYANVPQLDAKAR